MIEAAVQTLMVYYKYENPAKWTELFGNETVFLYQLCDFQQHWNDIPIGAYAHPVRGFAHRGYLDRVELIPWQTTLSESNLEKLGRINGRGSTYISQIVKSITNGSAFNKMCGRVTEVINPRLELVHIPHVIQRFDDRQEFILPTSDQIDPKMWAWLSMLNMERARSQARTTPMVGSYPVDLTVLDGIFRDQFFELPNKGLQTGGSSEKLCHAMPSSSVPPAISQMLQSRIREIQNSIWRINSKILDTLPANREDKPGWRDQDLAQEFFINLLIRTYGRKDDQKAHTHRGPTTPGINPALAESADLLLDSTLAKFKSLMREYLAGINRSETIFHVRNHFNFSRATLSVSREQIITIKIVIYVLGTYYKLVNYAKWCLFFDARETIFIHFIAKIQDRSVRDDIRQSVSTSPVKRLLAQFKIGVFPWVDKIEMSRIDTSKLKRQAGFMPFFHRPSSRNLSEFVLTPDSDQKY